MLEQEGLECTPVVGWGACWDSPSKPFRALGSLQSSASVYHCQQLPSPHLEAGPGLSFLCFLQVHVPPPQAMAHSLQQRAKPEEEVLEDVLSAGQGAGMVPAGQSESQVAPNLLILNVPWQWPSLPCSEAGPGLS